MVDFYAARDTTTTPLPWPSIAPPFTYPIEPAPAGDWQHISIPLADLAAHPGSTLDLSNVNTPLVIFPNWGNQRGVVLRVDNLRLSR